MNLGILADDLTGALDAAAAFASPGCPVEGRWDARPTTRRFAIDTGTRQALPQHASDAVRSGLGLLGGLDIAFKKVDSLLRGNTFAELAACAQSPNFVSRIVAPAFPAQGRSIVGGELIVDSARTGQNLASGLRVAGISATVTAPDADWPVAGLVLCDAQSSEDLAKVVRQGSAMTPPILWCGSAGLAMALAGRHEPLQDPPRPEMIIVGSQTDRSRADLARLADRPDVAAIRITDAKNPVPRNAPLSRRLVALSFDLPHLDPQEASSIYRRVLRWLVSAVPAPAAALVIGGDTASILVEAAGARNLEVVGAWAEGLPLSRVRGGLWDGGWLYTKSGSFDDRGLIGFSLRGGVARAH